MLFAAIYYIQGNHSVPWAHIAHVGKVEELIRLISRDIEHFGTDVHFECTKFVENPRQIITIDRPEGVKEYIFLVPIVNNGHSDMYDFVCTKT